ncbi:MAG TPA: hypothetical protein VH206_04660 [Xanthobacteraceae bacterium]|nr:hypothetical protein [Xanthobacteraceae bacterium]
MALALPCFAIADESPDTQGGRFNFTKLGDGLVRLDSQTGAVALCSRKGTGLACEIAPEDRALFETEIARLRGENATLKKELLSHGLPLPSGAMAEADGAAPGSSYLRMPTDADIDRAARFAGRVWHRFIEAVDRAQKQVLNKS